MHVLKAVVTGIAKEKQKRETKELEEILARGDTRRKEVAMKQEAEQPLPTSSFGQNTFEQQTKQQHVARTSSSHHSNLSLVEQMIANSALLQAAAKGNMRDVMMYVERGADINTEDNKGDTAITLALDWGHWDIANYLLQMGARINDEVGPLEKTDLDTAAEEGRLEKAMWLIQNGGSAHVHRMDGNGWTPFYRSILCKRGISNLHVVKYLYGLGSDLWHPLRENGRNALDLAVRTAHPRKELVLFLFQSAGANNGEKFATWINGKDRFGNTPVASVIHNCGTGYTEDDYTEVLEILLKHGPDLQSKDMYELTPLEFAKKFKKMKAAALLKAAIKGKLK